MNITVISVGKIKEKYFTALLMNIQSDFQGLRN